MSRARADADAALAGREQDLRSAQRHLSNARAEHLAAESNRAAAESELAAAQASVPSDTRYAAPALARVDSARSELAAARGREHRAHSEVEQARAHERRSHEARDRCASAQRRIHDAAADYRTAAITYVAASAAVVSAGRRTLGRLTGLLDEYLSIEAYSTTSATVSAATSPGSGTSQARAASRRTDPSWIKQFGVLLVPLAEIAPVPVDSCTALHRWDIERFESAVEELLPRDDWRELLAASDSRDGRTGERTLLGVVDRLCQRPVMLRRGSPITVISGHGYVAAAQRAGMAQLPAQFIEGTSDE